MKYPLVIANWKLNGNKKIIIHLLNELFNKINDSFEFTLIIIPPMLYLDMVAQYLINSSSKIILGAQNVDIHLSGPFTGEISVKMLEDIGVKYVIVGHSERRLYHKENNEQIAEKFAILKDNNLIPILCIGENKEENKSGKSTIVCMNQINAILNRSGIIGLKNSIIAYEPTWAVGTNLSADPLQVQNIHKFIRNYLSKYNKKIADQLIIQYGGSVNISNVYSFLIQPDINGVLLGSVSLKINEFTDILKVIDKISKKN